MTSATKAWAGLALALGSFAALLLKIIFEDAFGGRNFFSRSEQ